MLMIAAAFWPVWGPAGTLSATTSAGSAVGATAGNQLATTTSGGDA